MGVVVSIVTLFVGFVNAKIGSKAVTLYKLLGKVLSKLFALIF